MNAAEHYAAAEQLLAELESDQLESFAGSRQIAALVALSHATLAAAAEAGVPATAASPAAPRTCLTCGFSETAHTADSGPQGTSCDGSGPWASGDLPAGQVRNMVAQQNQPQS